MDASERAWIADPRTTCSLRYTRSAEPRTPRATVAGVDIEHGGPSALGPPPQYAQLPVPKADGPASPARLAPCRPSADTLKLGPGLLGIPSLERLGAWRLDVGSS